MKNKELEYKYWDSIGYWIHEDNGCNSYVFNAESPYFKSFVRYHKFVKKNISFLIFLYKQDGTRYIIQVEKGDYIFSPLEDLEERLKRFLHGHNFPKLYEEFYVVPRFNNDFLNMINGI